MILNFTLDSSVSNAPVGFTAELNAIASFFDNTFSDAVTVNIAVGYGEVAGQALGSGALGESETYLNNYSYAQIKSALTADAKTADDASAVASLPVNDPTGGHYFVPTAEAKAIGLSSSSGLDGYVGFSSNYAFDYNNSDGVTAGQFDFFGVVAHEVSEVMGRQLLVGATIGNTPNSYGIMDLFHFAAQNAHTFSGTQPGYFSPDNGVTDLGDFNTNPGGDAGDWAASAGHDAALAFTSAGEVDPFSQNDIRVMDTIGWDATSNSPPPPPPPPPPPTPADLTATNFAFSPTSVSFIINNVGSGAAGASAAGVYLSTDANITATDALLATVVTPSLAHGASDHESASITLPDNLTPGTYYLGALADSGNQITESNEANNASNTVAVLLGNSSGNALTGTSGNDVMFGFGGNDTLSGGTGGDTMIGGLGNDTYVVDNAGDVVVENLGEGTDTVNTSLKSYTLGANVENLIYTGSSSFTGTGNGLDNAIIGGTGNDVLNGGAGFDTMTGGLGADRFVFTPTDLSTGPAVGEITDFNHAQRDKIDLSAIDANTNQAGDQAFSFIGTQAFHHVAHELNYSINGTGVVVSGDTNGDGIADFAINVDGVHSLVSGDFVL